MNPKTNFLTISMITLLTNPLTYFLSWAFVRWWCVVKVHLLKPQYTKTKRYKFLLTCIICLQHVVRLTWVGFCLPLRISFEWNGILFDSRSVGSRIKRNSFWSGECGPISVGFIGFRGGFLYACTYEHWTCNITIYICFTVGEGDLRIFSDWM